MPDARYPILESRRVNDPEVLHLLNRLKPDVVVVSGTSILRKPILERAPCFLNIHCGVTPRYRGVYGGFWAVYEERLDQAGVTIHAIDKGVDTGEIARQGRIEVDRNDDPRSLMLKQYLVGTDLMCEAVEAAVQNRLRLSPASGPSRLWYHPTIWDLRRFRKHLSHLPYPNKLHAA